MNYPINVAAIDPGPTESTIVRCVFTCKTGLLSDPPLVIGGVESIGNHEMLDRLTMTFGWFVVCEMVACYGLAVGKEVFETVRWIGRFEQRLAERGAKMDVLFRMDVKMNLCHSARAKDTNIRQALIDRFGMVGTKKKPGALFGISGHAWAALGIGVTWMDRALTLEKESSREKKQVSALPNTTVHAPSCDVATGGKLLL